MRTASNPWGQEVLLGLAWNVLWLVVVLGALFVLVHAVFARKGADAHAHTGGAAAGALPARIERHSGRARVSHWILALATFALLITAFVPIIGLQFPWVTIHWIAGLVFGAYVVFHIVDTMTRGDGHFWSMLIISPMEIGRAIGRVKGFFSGGSEEERVGKWNFENKAFHWATALAGLAVLATGLLMFARVDTWFWEADPYVFAISDSTWGVVYVLHGIAAVGFVGLLIAHIYFALRPDKFFYTKSMIRGWITKEEYVEHFDPARWPVRGTQAPAPTPEEATVGASPSSESD